MQRRRFTHVALAVGLAGFITRRLPPSVGAQRRNPTTHPDPDSGMVVLGAVSAIAAPGYQIRLIRHTWSPSAPRVAHILSDAVVCCVVAGEVTFVVRTGMATAWHARDSGQPVLDVIVPDAPVVCGRGDCLAFGQDPIPAAYEAWTSGEETAELWEAQLASNPLARVWQCG